MNKVSLFLFTVIFPLAMAIAQPQVSTPKIKNIGLPLMTTYGPSDYNFSNQNFAVVVGDDQKIYIANHSGILVYDGMNWTSIILPNEASPYILNKSENGTVFVGATNEFGYLSWNEKGELIYVSLSAQLAVSETEQFVPYIINQGQKIIITYLSKLLIFDSDTHEVKWINTPDESDEWLLFVANDSIYAYANDWVYLLSQYKWKAHRKSTLTSIGPGIGLGVDLPGKRDLVVTQKGFMEAHSELPIEIPKETLDLLSQANIYSIYALSDEFIAISTWSGLIITDTNGRLIQHLTEEKGLPDNYVFGSALDTSGMLWVVTNKGITSIDIFSPFSVLDQKMGLDGIPLNFQLNQGSAYVSTFLGIFREQWEKLAQPQYLPSFELLSPMAAHGMINTDDEIITLNEAKKNVVITEDIIQPINGTEGLIFWTGAKFKNSDDILLGSLNGKLLHIAKENNTWVKKTALDPQLLSARMMVYGPNENIWVSSLKEGIFKLKYDTKTLKLTEDKYYGESKGLPSKLNNYIFDINSEPLVATSKGIYSFDLPNDQFILDPRFSDLVGEDNITFMDGDPIGNIYYMSEGISMLKKNADEYKRVDFPSLDYQHHALNWITAIDSSNVMLSTLNGLIHLDPTIRHEPAPFGIHLTKVSSLISDSVFYGGFGPTKALNLPIDDNALRIEFAAQYYQMADKNLYRWRLNNGGSEWSSWSKEQSKDYTNLSHGSYSFEVMAKNVYDEESQPSTFQFTILTPWYFTIWAYLLYSMAFTAFLWTLLRLNSRRLVQDKKKLEFIVQERTTEINHQKEELEEHRNKLLQMDEFKSRFFVNISHELRTPLTLIMGTVDQALKNKYGVLKEELYRSLKISYGNSQRLMKMVNNILDITKLEGGKVQLYAASTNPGSLLSKVTDFFVSRFFEKQINLVCDFETNTELYIDRDKFETIFINLLANAFKFTSSGGQITVRLSENTAQVVITVADDGMGIPAEDVPLVFDRFYQSGHIKSGEGMGVGLALTKELVELHSGKIIVESIETEGAKFSVSFLKGKAHLTANEIVDAIHLQEERPLDDKYPLHSDRMEKVDRQELEIINDQGKPHLLLVEDNSEMCQFIISLLSNQYQVSSAENGIEGLSFLSKQKPDLIITDYLMPEMNGFEMATEIKKSDDLAFIPIIFLTARAREQDKIEVLNLGVDDYLFKPFNAEELQVRIKNLLQNKQQRADYLIEESMEPNDIEWKDFSSTLKQNLEQYINDHIKEEIEPDLLVEYMGESKRSVYRKIKANTGLSLMQYIKEYRLRQAREMLENRAYHTVSEISYAVGFNYLSYFTKSYKERFGKRPSEYLE